MRNLSERIMLIMLAVAIFGAVALWVNSQDERPVAAIQSVSSQTVDMEHATVTFCFDATNCIVADAEVAIGELKGHDRNDGFAIAAKMTEKAQFAIDVHQLLADLPHDDPDKTTDPDLDCIFWDDEAVASHGASGNLVGRGELLTVTWTGEFYFPSTQQVSC